MLVRSVGVSRAPRAKAAKRAYLRSGRSIAALTSPDGRWLYVVDLGIDEIVGYLIAMTWLPLNWISLGLAFVLFRFFDILKPWPIREIDQRVGGGLGVVVDDVAAGIAASLILQVIYVQTNWLGSQWVGS